MLSLDDNVSLSCKLFSSHQIKMGEQQCAKKLGVDMYQLMERAGHSAFECALAHFPKTQKMLVLAGTGNNGGDGFVIARLALQSGLTVTLLTTKPEDKLTGDAEIARQTFINAGGDIGHVAELHKYIVDCDLVIDALIGTGLNRELTQELQEVITIVNHSGKLVIAIDIPTGISSDTGAVMPIAIQAHFTVTFIAGKLGLFTGDGPDHAGTIFLSGLGLHEDFCEMIHADALWQGRQAGMSLPQRSKNTHKGSFGHVVCVGGNQGMAGAIYLAGKAALRSGAGKVSVITHPDNVSAIVSLCPELIVYGVDVDDASMKSFVTEKINKADSIIFGPGLGLNHWSETLFELILRRQGDVTKPIICDADAINMVAQQSEQAIQSLKALTLIVTPHVLEAARLLNSTAKDINLTRVKSCHQISKKLNAVCVLKGVGTVTSDGQNSFINGTGNPGMATAGMGDVLSGVIAGIITSYQHLEITLVEKASMAVFLHGLAGDFAAKNGEVGMIASDVIEQLPAAIRQTENKLLTQG